MHIGLIGGIGPAATDFYYRRLTSTFASKKAALELTIVHADTPTLLGNLANKDAASQFAIFMKLTNRLAAAGADCVAITRKRCGDSGMLLATGYRYQHRH